MRRGCQQLSGIMVRGPPPVQRFSRVAQAAKSAAVTLGTLSDIGFIVQGFVPPT